MCLEKQKGGNWTELVFCSPKRGVIFAASCLFYVSKISASVGHLWLISKCYLRKWKFGWVTGNCCKIPKKNTEWNHFKEKAAVVHAWRAIKEGKKDTFVKLARFKETVLKEAAVNIAQKLSKWKELRTLCTMWVKCLRQDNPDRLCRQGFCDKRPA